MLPKDCPFHRLHEISHSEIQCLAREIHCVTESDEKKGVKLEE